MSGRIMDKPPQDLRYRASTWAGLVAALVLIWGAAIFAFFHYVHF